MGITIHYKGKLNNPDLIIPFRDEMIDISNEMGWNYNVLDEDLEAPNTAYIVPVSYNEETDETTGGSIKGTVPLKGVIIRIHKDSEPLSLLSDKHGNFRNLISMAIEAKDKKSSMYNFIKTQFAPVDVHITVVKLLKYIKKKYTSNLEVFDEGMYWETEDKELLTEKIMFLNKMMDKLESVLTQIEKVDNATPESIADKIEEVLKKKFGFN